MFEPGLKFVYWFAFYNTASPSVRYRGQYPLEFLKKEYGIDSYFVVPGYRPAKILKFILAYFSALFFRKRNSLIVVQRLNTNWIYANALKILVRFQKAGTVYDLDDADYLENPPKSIFNFIKNCSAVHAGSKELTVHLSSFNNNILINTSPTPDLRIVKKKRNPLLTVGWIGEFGGGHKESLLKYFFPCLEEIPFKVKLILLGVVRRAEHEFLINYFKNLKNVSLEMPQNIDWKNEQEIQERIATFDIGIATLLDDEIHRSKSGFKAKQYMNSGVPVLSSDLPENNSFVVHGHNGFLCNTPGDFREQLIEIHTMSIDHYLKLSDHARQSIHYFDLKKYCENLLLLYKKTLPDERPLARAFVSETLG